MKNYLLVSCDQKQLVDLKKSDIYVLCAKEMTESY